MKALSGLFIPVAFSMVALSLIVLMLPEGAAASSDQGYLPEEILVAQGCLFCDKKDIQLSGPNGRLPEVAANGTFVALVYEQSNSILLRAVEKNDGEWYAASFPVDTTNGGNTPKLAFDATTTNIVHLVWSGFVSGVANKAIRHAACTLTAVSASCAVNTIDTAASGSFVSPVIAVQSTNNRLHVAWFDSGQQKIKTAYSIDGGSSWTNGLVDISVTGSNLVGKPALAVSGSNVHLAYIDNDGQPTPGQFLVKYLRLDDGHGAANVGKDYGGSVDEAVDGFDQIDNVDVSATGSKVYLVWDNRPTDASNDLFGLTGAENTSDGDAAGWSLVKPKHITSTNDANPGEPPGNRKASRDGGSPGEEVALRPSLAISSGNFVVAWQQRPSTDCDPLGPVNGSSEIYFADNSADGTPANSWQRWGTLTDTTVLNSLAEYSIDPDIAVDSSGTHVVFMKFNSDAQNCNHGAVEQYAVYYRGPFEAVKQQGTYLPIIRKNS